MTKIIIDLLESTNKFPNFIWRASYPELIDKKRPIRAYFDKFAEKVFPQGEIYSYIGEVLRELYFNNESLLRKGQFNWVNIYSDSEKNKLIDWNSVTGIRKWPRGESKIFLHSNLFKNGINYKEMQSKDSKFMLTQEFENMLKSESKYSFTNNPKDILSFQTKKRIILDD